MYSTGTHTTGEMLTGIPSIQNGMEGQSFQNALDINHESRDTCGQFMNENYEESTTQR